MPWQKKKKKSDEVVVSDKIKMRAGTVRLQKMYRIDGSASEDTEAEFIDVRTFPKNVEPTKIGTHLSMTVNLGNFNSVKVGVYVELPCFVEEIDDAYRAAKKIAEEKITKEIEEIKEWKKRVRVNNEE